jgi:hypothetical protein
MGDSPFGLAMLHGAKEISGIEYRCPFLRSRYFFHPFQPAFSVRSKESIPKVPTPWNNESIVNTISLLAGGCTFGDQVSHPQTQLQYEVQETLP